MPPNLNRKINLLHIIGSVYKYGGLERKVIQLINNLDKSVFNCYLVTLIRYNHDDHFVNLDIPIFSLEKQDGINFGIIPKLVKILKENNIQVIHSHNWVTLFHAVIAAKMANIPVIIHGEHGIETKNIEDSWRRYLVKKVLYYLCDHLIGISEEIKKTLIKNYRIPSKKVTVVHNGVEIYKSNQNRNKVKIKKKYQLEDYSLIIGSVGRIKPVKDFMTLIRAFQIIKDKYIDSALVIVGPGNDDSNPYYKELRDLLDELNIKTVFFTGIIENIPEVLAVFDIFINTSLSEGISNTILEAMANKIPVVASRVGGNPELIEHERSGLLFESQNEQECAKCMIKILDDPDIKSRYIKNAFENVMQNHTMESMYQKNANLYTELLSIKTNYL